MRTRVLKTFRDVRGAFKRGPAAVISKTFVAGLHPPEVKVKVVSKLDMKARRSVAKFSISTGGGYRMAHDGAGR